MKRTIFSLALIFSSLFLFSNGVGYSKVTGIAGMIYPMVNENLDMVREKIDIDVFLLSDSGLFYVEFNCRYYFKNIGLNQLFLMGFPIDYNYDKYRNEIYMLGMGHFIDPQITDFQLRINNNEKDYKLYSHGFNPEISKINYDEAYGFDLYLKHNETAQVEIRYSQIISSFIGANINYIFKSGTLLKNPIGKAEIDVIFHCPINKLNERIDFSHDGIIQVDEAKATTAISWIIADFIPESDLIINIGDLNDYIEKVPKHSFKSLLKRIGTEYCIQSYFYLMNLLDNGKIKIGKDDSAFYKTMQTFYDYYLSKDEAFNNLMGFFLDDIEADSKLSPGSLIVEKVNDRVKRKAQMHSSKEIERLRNIIISVERNQSDRNLIRKAETVLYSPYQKRAGLNQYSLEDSNLFFKYITGANKGYEYKGCLSKLEESILIANRKIINRQQENN